MDQLFSLSEPVIRKSVTKIFEKHNDPVTDSLDGPGSAAWRTARVLAAKFCELSKFEVTCARIKNTYQVIGCF